MSGTTMRTVTTCTRLLLIPLLALAAGCLYRMPVQQGNLLDESQVAQLQTGLADAFRDLFDSVNAERKSAPGDAKPLFEELDLLVDQYNSHL